MSSLPRVPTESEKFSTTAPFLYWSYNMKIWTSWHYPTFSWNRATGRIVQWTGEDWVGIRNRLIQRELFDD